MSGIPWCKFCGSYHPKPRDEEHARLLRCFDPKWPHNGARTHSPAAAPDAEKSANEKEPTHETPQ